MEEKEIEQRVKRIICNTLRLQPEAVDKTSDLIREFDADSLDVMCVQTAIEDEFDIAISWEVAGELNTIGKYVDYVRKKVC